MGEALYRDGEESLKAILAQLCRRSGELGPRIDRAYLARFDRPRVTRLDKKWVAAWKALGDIETTEGLTRACEAHRVFIAELEDALATGVSAVQIASAKDRERGHRMIRIALVLSLVVGALAFAGCVAFSCATYDPRPLYY
jgi:hypothetical protein